MRCQLCGVNDPSLLFPQGLLTLVEQFQRISEGSKITSDIDEILNRFGTERSAQLGRGTEASVYDLGNGTVLRLTNSVIDAEQASARISLLSNLGSTGGGHNFQIPRVQDHGTVQGLHFTIEDRLEGEAMSEALSQSSGSQRQDLIEDYMETSAKIAALYTGKENLFGDIAAIQGIRRSTFKGYLRDRALAALAESRLQIDVEELIAPFEEPVQKELVHLDYHPANVLCHEGAVTAVLDFGSTSLVGCRSFNPAIAFAFLDPRITPSATCYDQHQANGWLKKRELCTSSSAAIRWLAVYWSFCRVDDDPVLFRWCRDTLAVQLQS
jgi:hypothetical protein